MYVLTDWLAEQVAMDDEDYVAQNGLSSRRRMHDSYRIMQANNVERESGSEEAIISVSFMNPLPVQFFPCTIFFPFLTDEYSFRMLSFCNFC